MLYNKFLMYLDINFSFLRLKNVNKKINFLTKICFFRIFYIYLHRFQALQLDPPLDSGAEVG